MKTRRMPLHPLKQRKMDLINKEPGRIRFSRTRRRRSWLVATQLPWISKLPTAAPTLLQMRQEGDTLDRSSQSQIVSANATPQHWTSQLLGEYMPHEIDTKETGSLVPPFQADTEYPSSSMTSPPTSFLCLPFGSRATSESRELPASRSALSTYFRESLLFRQPVKSGDKVATSLKKR